MNGRSRSAEVGEAIRSRRLKLGLTFGALGKASGIERSTIYMKEVGRRPLRVGDIEALASALFCAEIDLLPAKWRERWTKSKGTVARSIRKPRALDSFKLDDVETMAQALGVPEIALLPAEWRKRWAKAEAKR